MRAWSTVSAAVAPNSPAATPSSIALVRSQGRGSGITSQRYCRGCRLRLYRHGAPCRYWAGRTTRLRGSFDGGRDHRRALRRPLTSLVVGSGDDPSRRQLGVLGLREDPSAGQEPLTFGRFQAEPAAAAGDHVDDELGVLPRLKLRPRDPYRHPVGSDVEHAEQHVAVTDDEVAIGVAHRRRPVTAATGLMNHQRAVLLP